MALGINKKRSQSKILLPIYDFTFEDLLKQSPKASLAINWDGSCYCDEYWDTVDEDLIKFSQQYPFVVFKLIVEGTDNNDRWITYYHKGKYQCCPAITIYDDFNFNKLIEYTDISVRLKSHPFDEKAISI